MSLADPRDPASQKQGESLGVYSDCHLAKRPRREDGEAEERGVERRSTGF